MASRTEEGTGDSKEKVRFLESKVYTRKGKGTKKNTTAASTTTIPTSLSSNPATNNNTSITVNPPPNSDTTSFTENSTYIGVTADPAKDTSVTADPGHTETFVNPTNKDASSTADPANNSSFTPYHESNENSFAANPASNSKENNNNNGKEEEINNHKDDSVEQHSQAIAPEEAASSQHHVISRLDAVADDVSSLNRQQDVTPGWQQQPLENGLIMEVEDERFKVNVPSRSKDEVRELKRKLESELNLVRSWAKKFEDKALQLVNGGVVVSNSKMSLSHGVDNGVRRVHPDIASAGVFLEGFTPRQSKPLNHLSISVLENNQASIENVEKEKRTPKANQFYRNTEFLLAKDKFPPAESNKRPKLNGKKHRVELGHGFGSGSKVFRSCSSLLERLMKHKHGWVFEAPVAVEALGLHDYFDIIKYPMDLGTVKAKLNKNCYKSPREFAEDVRLTFSNAMIYNPVGQDVHVMAEQLSKIFEEKWVSIELDYNHEMRLRVHYATGGQAPTSRKFPPFRPPPLDMKRIIDRSESTIHPPPPSVRTPAPKKPKAKDLHKRDMTYEEKQKLSSHLQDLPPEKMNNIVEIIKKRNSTLSQHDDEIEVDIDSVDAETLWELDRFVTNFKKSLSKNKRKAERALQAQAQAVQNAQKQIPTTIAAEASKEMDMDGRNVSGSPVRGGVGDNASSSSSSSSSESGSSSSDSDSDSSSSSESDEGHSPRT